MSYRLFSGNFPIFYYRKIRKFTGVTPTVLQFRSAEPKLQHCVHQYVYMLEGGISGLQNRVECPGCWVARIDVAQLADQPGGIVFYAGSDGKGDGKEEAFDRSR